MIGTFITYALYCLITMTETVFVIKKHRSGYDSASDMRVCQSVNSMMKIVMDMGDDIGGIEGREIDNNLETYFCVDGVIYVEEKVLIE